MTALGTDQLAGLDRVSLEQLNDRAALMHRQENKYLVDAADFSAALGELGEHFDVLDIEGRTAFSYSTVYFDSEALAAYHQHAQGKRRRFKVRSRQYLDTGLCYFEVKLKGTRDRTIKQRMVYRPDEHGGVTAAAQAFVQRCFQDVYDQVFDHELSAQLAMRYRRVTLVGKHSPERVTIDYDLEFQRGDDAAVATPGQWLIVEVKSERGRGTADRVLQRRGIRSSRCSKYCIGLNLVRRDLRYNAFKPTLQSYFGWSSPAAPEPQAVPLPVPFAA